jgi:hypothetical protein
MREVRQGVRCVRRITDVDVEEFGGIATRLDEFKVARKVWELGIMTAALDAP